jgi:Ras-related protein Rab-6A
MYKLVLLGDAAVGKTSIITRFAFDEFKTNYRVTIGVDFVARTLHLNNRAVRLQLWDTAGQERYRALVPSYVRDSSAAIVVYDVSSRESFENTDAWINVVREERGEDNVLIMLVGNKTDLQENRQVSLGEGEAKARKLGIMFVETSAKGGFNVKGLFRKLAAGLPSEQAEEPDRSKIVDVSVDTYVAVDENGNPVAQACNC